MNKVFVFLAIISVIYGCNGTKKKKKSEPREIELVGSFKLSLFTDSLLMDYIKSVPNKPAYAIFIDKKSEQKEEFVLTFAPFNSSLKDINESGAMCYFMLEDSTPIFIYSGMEDFVLGTTTFRESKERPKDIPNKGEFKYFDPIRRKVDFSKSRSFVQKDSISYIIEPNNFPFININILPDQNW